MPRPASVVVPPRVRERIRRAAYLRATGAAWEAVASELNATADAVRAWERKYPAAWRGAERAAGERVLAEATAEAVFTLRKHLRSDDEKASRDAATKIVQYSGRARRVVRKPPAKGKPAGAVAGAVAMLEGMTDAELDAFIAEVLPAHDARHDRRARAPDPPGAGGPD